MDLVSDHHASSDVPQPADPPDHRLAPLVQTQTDTQTGLTQELTAATAEALIWTDTGVSMLSVNCYVKARIQIMSQITADTNK